MTNDALRRVSASERQHVFPPPLERHYRVHDSRVQTRSLEAHVVDHCNLTCAGCCSFSPLLPAWFASPDSVAEDVHKAAKVLKPRVFKLVGGEPLLHPQLGEMIRCVRESRIAPTLSVTTNGLKLHEMPDTFWQAVDALTISLYRRPRLSSALITHIEMQARRFGVHVTWKVQDVFTTLDRAHACTDLDETRRIYHDCWLRERCHMIRDGMFYTCTRPPHFHTLYKGTVDFQADGLPLRDDNSMLDALLAYLQRETPLTTCLHCLGGNAPVAPHRVMKRTEVERLKARYP